MPDYGQLIRTEDRAVLQYRRRYGHSPEKVWRALTEPAELAAWFPTTIEGDRAVGAALTFGFEEVEIAPMEGEMLEYDPPQRLEFTWGPDRVRFELARDGEATVMTMTVTLEELGKATRDGAGWHQCLDALDRRLAGDHSRDYDPDRWRVLRDSYAEQFGPEASVLGPPQEWEDEFGEP